jgi:DNA-binding transcriptional LysR family regulator
LNIHHLELFHYVAKHGGISQAVRHMPYGIQQPAVSGQILQLEESLGGRLFQRRPFALTPSGRRLAEFIAPFFANLDEISAELRGEAGQRLRLAASASVLRDYVPRQLQELRKTFPILRLALHQADQAAAETLLQRQEIDLAITELADRPAPGLKAATLLKLPPVLLTLRDSPIRSARELWTREIIEEPLIVISEGAILTKLFQNELRRRNRRWPVAVEASSLTLVETYVAEGFGLGLSVAASRMLENPALRALPLPGFAPLVVAALWQGKLPPLPAAFLESVKVRAAQMAAEMRGQKGA